MAATFIRVGKTVSLAPPDMMGYGGGWFGGRRDVGKQRDAGVTVRRQR